MRKMASDSFSNPSRLCSYSMGGPFNSSSHSCAYSSSFYHINFMLLKMNEDVQLERSDEELFLKIGKIVAGRCIGYSLEQSSGLGSVMSGGGGGGGRWL